MKTQLKGTTAKVESTPAGLPDGFKLWPKKQVLADQDRIFQSVKDLDDDIKQNALQCMAHAKAHGDVTLMDRLIERLPKGYLNAGFQTWMTANSPIRFDTNGDLKQAKQGDPGYRPYNLEAAKEAPIAKRAVNANRGERKVGLAEVINMFSGVRRKVEKAEERGELVQADKPAILRVLAAEEATLHELEAKLPKPAKTISVGDEAQAANLKKTRGKAPKVIKRRGRPAGSGKRDVIARIADKLAA